VRQGINTEFLSRNILKKKKSLLGRPRKWEANMKMNNGEISCEHRRWMELAQDLVEWQTLITAMLNLQVLLP
jgi:hypothetical protein